MVNSVFLEVVTPEQLFYKGDVEMVIAPTLDGYEGFMANHSHACVLLEKGKLKFREVGQTELKAVNIESGYIDVKDTFVVFCDHAEWAK
ncbi:MAG TPA: F0F1 ATP synthase subunit epsilon [Anaerovoracaceae bacterium]|nr:F0F1 ATP synthase subunit epsilon [Anaerovoracaceae bacterium]